MTQQEQPDLEEQLKLRLWAGEYWDKGFPIVRLLADLAIEKTRTYAAKESLE